ncbi:RUS family member 1 isoform X3 [Sturnira hondurensis]|uniref:RUS family member 1 isoform X3 n=1 Tax=Sturnira hondurensis TaxID=192404 RepID=UPI001879F8A8|nr:RUS family member 1 isoform X3 [Sturnira hondurensis]
MVGRASIGGPLCTEQFGSQAARGCCAAADGSLQWETWGWCWWGFSGAGTANPEGRDAGGGGAPRTAFPPLSRLLAVFLPQGFPDSVSPDYLPYQLWDSVQAFASSLSGSLATHAVLLGIGVGNAKASVSAATATWIVKDSAGMLGRIIFAWWKGSKLDCNAKQWRLFADILNDVAMFLEIMAPIYPICFTVTICISNLAKETLVNLAGLLVSLLMLPLVSDCPSLSLSCFFLLTALHIYANYRAVHALVIETLNEGRLCLVLKHFLQSGEVLDPTSANRMEPLWTGFWPSLSLSLGVPLHRLISSVLELQQLVEGHREPYLLHWDQSQNRVQVVLSQMAGPETILRAATHGLVLGALKEDGPLPRELEELRNQVRAELLVLHPHPGSKKESWVIIKDTHQVLDKLFPEFLKGLQDVGWKTERHQLEVDEWRATWLLSPEKKVL